MRVAHGQMSHKARRATRSDAADALVSRAAPSLRHADATPCSSIFHHVEQHAVSGEQNTRPSATTFCSDVLMTMSTTRSGHHVSGAYKEQHIKQQRVAISGSMRHIKNGNAVRRVMAENAPEHDEQTYKGIHIQHNSKNTTETIPQDKNPTDCQDDHMRAAARGVSSGAIDYRRLPSTRSPPSGVRAKTGVQKQPKRCSPCHVHAKIHHAFMIRQNRTLSLQQQKSARGRPGARPADS